MGSTLANKVFISTRPAGQNDELQSLLEREGARLLEMPTIEIQSSAINKREQKIFEDLNQFTWIVFTSPNGIQFFFSKLKEIQGDYKLSTTIKLAVIGQKTQTLLADFGHKASLVNPGNTSIELGTKLMSIIKNTDHLLFPEGDLALGKIKKMLSLIAQCSSIVVYENKAPQSINQTIIEDIINNQYDQIILTSPSGFNNLLDALKGRIDSTKLRFICIGTTTATAVRTKGLEPKKTARMSNAKGIFDSIIDLYQ